MQSSTTVNGVMLLFLCHQQGCNGSVWSNGKRLESHRVLLGSWITGEKHPRVHPIATKTLQTCGAPRTLRRHYVHYKELVNYHVTNVN